MLNQQKIWEQDWLDRLEANQEVRRARQDLEHHRKKVRELTEQLSSAEAWEHQLEMKEKECAQKCKPALMRFNEELVDVGSDRAVSQPLLEELVAGQGWENVLAVVRHRIVSANSLSRQESLGLVKVMFSLRDLYMEKEVDGAVSGLQDMAKRLLRQLGGPGQSWDGLAAGEAAILREVVAEV